MILPLALARAEQTVTWIKVQKPTLDLVGIVLSSLGLAGLCALVAMALGTALGLTFIVRSRRHPPQSRAERGLRLLEARRP